MTYEDFVMAYPSLPKLVPIKNFKLNFEDMKVNEFNELLLSESGKCLNQPNIIKAVSSSLSDSQKILTTGRHENNQNQTSIVENSMSLKNPVSCDDDNLLPSKKSGKSEITLLPLKWEKKSCGHCEPCENIICDINIQQYIDQEGSSMLAVNIDDSEITASVSKHCNNSQCDSLSIEHNRCRRAIIYLYRCDKSSICDICKTPLKTRKSRVYHRNCKRKDEYQHNRASGAQVLRERMRERELQMMEAVRTKQNNYSDPLTGHVKAMEVLKNNSELIVIPKTIMTMAQCNKSNNSPSNSTLRNMNCASEIVNNISTTLNSYLKKITSGNESHSLNAAITKKPQDQPDNNHFIVTTMSQTNLAYPLALNDWVITPSLKGSSIQTQNPYFIPVKVIPIKNLKSEPSLQHHTQGLPKFCIVPDDSVPSPSFVSVQNITSLQNQDQSIRRDTINSLQTPQKHFTNASKTAQANVTKVKSCNKKEMPYLVNNTINSKKYFDDHKKPVENKAFQCSYCSKKFLTDWYFKLHVSRHTGEKKIACNDCDINFTSNYDLKRHVQVEHKDVKVHIGKNSEINNKVNNGKCNVSFDEDNNDFKSSDELEIEECINFNKDISFKNIEEKTMISAKTYKFHNKKKF